MAGPPSQGGTPVFIGDELSALGYRLAGARTVVPDDVDLAESFDSACAEASLVLITAGLAARLPRGRLGQALSSGALVVIVPDVQNRSQMPDTAELVRRQLGIES